MKNTIILITIAIVIGVVVVAGVSVWFFNPDRKANIEQAIEEAQYCKVKSDCVRVESKCPFDCYTFVNKKEADRIQTLIDAYESKCMYLCVEFKGYDCVNNKCEVLYLDEGKNRAALLENCANAEIPLTGERNTVYDSENKTLEVSFWNGELQKDVLVIFPYEPETDFAGCSDSAKDILRHVQELNEENIRSGLE